MPPPTFTITTVENDGVREIHVSPDEIREEKAKPIFFDNQLLVADPTSTDKAPISITFFDYPKGSGPAVADFCTNKSGPDLPVAADTRQNCVLLDNEGVYAFTVSATGYQDLDPIIIVDPPDVAMGNLITIAAVGAVLIAALSYYIGFRRGSAKN